MGRNLIRGNGDTPKSNTTTKTNTTVIKDVGPKTTTITTITTTVTTTVKKETKISVTPKGEYFKETMKKISDVI